MTIQKTDKTVLSSGDILKYIEEYEEHEVPRLTRLWHYYKGKNDTILDREKPDPNSPDNRTPVPYGRKIITTFTGYAFRPRYITYKAAAGKDDAYMKLIQANFDLNNEHIRTSRAGRNIGIFGVAYELLFVEGIQTGQQALPIKAEPRFIKVDPREIILLYDYSPDPKVIIGIHYYKVEEWLYKVEVYYPQTVELYDRYQDKDNNEWRLRSTGTAWNPFDAVPIVPYYMGDDMLGVIEPVLPLIDDYDNLMSDSFNEFDRFANAYLIFKKMSLVPPDKVKTPGIMSRALEFLKRRRIIELIGEDADVKFLTKDVPTNFVQFISGLLKDEIHEQSHVPDFKEMATGTLSGAAIKRLLFDFENMVASADGDFDTGLIERMRLITTILAKRGEQVGTPADITISHKRNLPSDLQEAAQTAVQLKAAGFSQYVVADSMPDDLIPDVGAELKREQEEMQAALPDVTNIPQDQSPAQPVNAGG